MEGELASVAARPWLRFAAAAGGGLAFDHGSRGLLVLDARLDIGLDDLRRTRLGGEAALWLVDGIGAEGRALLTIARSQIAHRFELGVGAGAQFGHGSGIAGSLRLGIATPVPGLAGFIRYDAAALISRSPVEAAHAIALGLELAF
jgi:hypothetical protein